MGSTLQQDTSDNGHMCDKCYIIVCTGITNIIMIPICLKQRKSSKYQRMFWHFYEMLCEYKIA